jgi:hypothetical protein
MKLPRMTTRRWMVTVAIVAIGLAILSHWRLSRTSRVPRCIRLPAYEIDPPTLPWGFDPYELDASPPEPETVINSRCGRGTITAGRSAKPD